MLVKKLFLRKFSGIKSIIHEYLFKDPLEQEAIYRIRGLINNAQPYILVSGGKDSLVVLDLVKKATRFTNKKPIAIHANTTVAIPDNLKYVKRICEKLSVKLEVVEPSKSFFELTRQKGFPTFHGRWCCYYLKLFPVREYFRDKYEARVVFDGVRSEESRLRRNTPMLQWRDFLGCYLHHPILHWKKVDVENYLSRYDMPVNPLYPLGFKRAAECWCGVFKSVEEFKLLKKYYPEFFNRLLELEASMRKGGSYLFIGGKKIYLQEIANGNHVRTLRSHI